MRKLLLVVVHIIPALALADLRTNIEALLTTPSLKRAGYGVIVMNADNQSILFERGADFLLTPASNTKLFTAATALDTLGPEFRFTTNVYRRGDDLVLVGGGDPVIEPTDFDILAKSIAAKGVSHANRVWYDDSLFDNDRSCDGWAVDDTIWYYGAEISPLTCARNSVAVYASPGGKNGDLPTIRLSPPTNYFLVLNRAVTGATTDLSLTRRLGQNTIILDGTIGVGAKETHAGTLAAVDASCYVASLFTDSLRKNGIRVDNEPVASRLTKEDTLVASLPSKPVKDILPLFLKPSDNLVGECLLKDVGAFKGRAGTTQAGRTAELAVMKKASLEADGLMLFDGSGLSRMTAVSARNIAALLYYMHHHSYADMFRTALPVAGKDGTLRNRLKTEVLGNAFAKTGSLFSVSSLSGYVRTKSGRWLIFAIIINHYIGPAAAIRRLQDAIVEHIYQED